jgi:hypothetical protein
VLRTAEHKFYTFQRSHSIYSTRSMIFNTVAKSRRNTRRPAGFAGGLLLFQLIANNKYPRSLRFLSRWPDSANNITFHRYVASSYSIVSVSLIGIPHMPSSVRNMYLYMCSGWLVMHGNYEPLDAFRLAIYHRELMPNVVL